MIMKKYTECGGSATRIFRLESPGSFQTVLAADGKCWENAGSTSSTSTNDAAGLTDYLTCGGCTAPPTPPSQDIEIQECGTTTPTYKVRTVGTDGYLVAKH